MRVLVTSAGTATAVNLIKELKKFDDLEVFAADVNEYGYTAGSILADGYFKLPYAIDESYCKRLLSIIEEERINFLIPVNDAEIEVLAKENSRVFLCDSILPSYEIVRMVRDKKTCNAEAAKIGAILPDYLSPNDQVKRICRDRISVGSKGVKIYESNEIVEAFSSQKQIMQRFVDGDEYTVDILCDREGKALIIVPRRRIEVKAGVATKVEIVNDKKLIDFSMKIVEKICLPGFSNIQFIKGHDGRDYFIEINPRFSGCGVASLLACDKIIECFHQLMYGKHVDRINDQNVLWGAIVTRYYEEKIFCKNYS